MLEGREWYKQDGATSADIKALIDIAPIKLPDELLDLLRFSSGGEGPLPVQPLWFVLYPTSEIVEIEQSRTFKEFFEGLFVLGGNGGGEAIAIDYRQPAQLRIVSFDMANIDLNESVWEVADDFAAFMNLIGIPATGQ